MNRIGKSELCWGEQMSVDDMLARIAAVTPDEVRAVAREVLGQRPSLSVIGPLKDKQAARLARSRRLTRPPTLRKQAMSKLRVAVLGAKGRIGSEAVRAVEAADDMELVAALGRGDKLETLAEAGAQVAVELTTPASVMGNLDFCVRHGIHAVVGTTGWTDERLAQLNSWLAGSPETGVLIAPNFSIGAVLTMKFAQQAAPLLRVRRGRRAAPPEQGRRPLRHRHPHRPAHRRGPRARPARAPQPDATATALDGARGADVDGVPVHAVRLRGLLAHQEVLLGGEGETLTIRHDSLHHSSFMPGILLGARRVVTTPGLTFGLEHFLDLG